MALLGHFATVIEESSGCFNTAGKVERVYWREGAAMGPDSQSRRSLPVSALATDRLAAADHGQLPANAALITTELRRVGSAPERPRAAYAPIQRENFFGLIGELSLRAVRSHPKT